MEFQRAYSGAPWEQKVGYCRALRAGHQIFVTGTASMDEAGSVHAPHDAYQQTLRCLQLIETALNNLRASRTNIVRTRMCVTDIRLWPEYGRAHKEFFGNLVPATSMVEVKSLILPDMLIEIEADAVADNLLEEP